MPNRSVTAGAIELSFAAALSARTSSSGSQGKVLTPGDLPSSLRFIERGPVANAIQHAATIMLQVDPEGMGFPGGLRNRNEITVIPAMDLNGDGVTVPGEIIEAIRRVAQAGRK